MLIADNNYEFLVICVLQAYLLETFLRLLLFTQEVRTKLMF